MCISAMTILQLILSEAIWFSNMILIITSTSKIYMVLEIAIICCIILQNIWSIIIYLIKFAKFSNIKTFFSFKLCSDMLLTNTYSFSGIMQPTLGSFHVSIHSVNSDRQFFTGRRDIFGIWPLEFLNRPANLHILSKLSGNTLNYTS